jgi:hypothetical protein
MRRSKVESVALNEYIVYGSYILFIYIFTVEINKRYFTILHMNKWKYESKISA